MAELIQALLLFFAFLWLAVDLNNLTRTVNEMALDLSKLNDAEAALIAQMERVISLVTEKSAEILDLTQRLSAAVAAADPAATQAAQDAINAAAQAMADEAAKASAVS